MKFKSLATMLLVLAVPVIASLFNTFSQADYGRCMVWDSAHYAVSGKLLLDWLKQLAAGHYQNPHDMEMGYALLLDGLPMPALAASLIYIADLLHCPQTVTLLCAQSVIAGLNGLLIYLLCRRIGLSRRFCAGGAMAWGFYPGQVINAARFMTEPPAACLLLLVVYLLSSLLPRHAGNDQENNQNQPALAYFGRAMLAGALIALLAHVKTVLTPLSLVLTGLCLLNVKPLKKCFISTTMLAVGGFLALIPWLAFTQVTLHHRTLLPDRQSGYNMAMGVDTDYEGWATFPAGSRLDMTREDNSVRTLAAAIKDRPQALSVLFARKLERLWKNNWNDFYADSLGLKRSGQISVHQLLLLCAILGTFYLLISESLLSEKLMGLSASSFIKIAALMAVSFHLVYIPFETQARYAFPATPWLLILALIGLDHLKHTWNSRLAIICATFTVFILLFARVDLAPLLVHNLGTIEKAGTAIDFCMALTVAVWLSVCYLVAAVKRNGQMSRSLQLRMALVGLFSLGLAFAYLCLRGINLPPQLWYAQLRPGESVERSLEIDARLARIWAKRFAQGDPGAWAAVVVDGDQGLESSTIELNGTALGCPESLIKLADSESKEPSESIIFTETARACGRKPEQMRQWRIIPLDGRALNLGSTALLGRLNLKLTAGKNGALIFGQYPQSSGRQQMLPDLWGFSFGKSTMDNDIRPINTTSLTPPGKAVSRCLSATSSSDLSSCAGRQTGQYRLHLVLGLRNSANSQASKIRHSFTQLF